MIDPNLNLQIRKVMLESPSPIAQGWDVLRKARAAKHAHLTDKELFMAGAGFLFDAIIHSMTAAEEPTEEDMRLISKIHDELVAFHNHFNAKIRL